jgi:trimeric autotransporter adhesin
MRNQHFEVSLRASHPAARSVRMILGITAAIGLLSDSIAQCTQQWLPGGGLPGVTGIVRDTLAWDPDGAGPQAEVLVVAGEFQVAGNALASNIASYDPTTGTWLPLGAGTNASVQALGRLPNGDLVAGGAFTTAGGVIANRMARWNGTTWSALGAGPSSAIFSLATLANGDLLAGCGGGGMSVERWDGTSWSVFVTGPNGIAESLAEMPNGDLVVGGTFTVVGGVPASNVARWNGSSWSALGPGLNSSVRALMAMPNGDLVGGGSFYLPGFVSPSVARWNGTSWVAMGTGLGSAVDDFASLPNGDLIAVGGEVARWNGATWSTLGTLGSNDSANTVTRLANGDHVIGGEIRGVDALAVSGLATWNGSSWARLSSGSPATDGQINVLLPLPNGDVIAGGWFTTAGGVLANRIARWNGSSWSALGSGMDANRVDALAVLPNGDLVAGGQFSMAGGAPADNIARWNGASWSALGSGMNGEVLALAVLPTGDLVAGGSFTMAGGVPTNRIARWNGTSWSTLGSGVSGTAPFSPLPWPQVLALTTLPNGSLVAGGSFTHAGGTASNGIARWDGTSWSPMGSGTNGVVRALLGQPDGSLFAGGSFSVAGGATAVRVARWNGASWSGVGTGLSPGVAAVVALTNLPDGDLVAAAQPPGIGAQLSSPLLRWSGSVWLPIATGFDRAANTVAWWPGGALLAGGSFTAVGSVVSACFARQTTSCPAVASSLGGGCPGSGGANDYTVRSLPWIGATFRARSTTVPQSAFVVVVTGFSPVSLPLAGLLPPSQPACNLLVSPDDLVVMLSNAGTVDTAIAIPNHQALVGLTLHQQLVLLEFDQGFAFVDNTSSNSLALVVGSF